MIVSADFAELSHGLYHIAGVTVEVRIDSDASSETIDETLASVLTAVAKAVKKCEPTVAPLARQYRQASVIRQSHFKHQIREHHRTWLRDICPEKFLSYCADLLTDCAVSDVDVVHAAAVHSIILYCRVTTVEALSDLKQMIDSGRLSQLFSSMYTASANTGLMSRFVGGIFRRFASTAITATVNLSTEEYTTALAALILCNILRRMTVTDHMSTLFGGIFSQFAGTAITATVRLSTEEYSRAFESITGKFH